MRLRNRTSELQRLAYSQPEAAEVAAVGLTHIKEALRCGELAEVEFPGRRRKVILHDDLHQYLLQTADTSTDVRADQDRQASAPSRGGMAHGIRGAGNKVRAAGGENSSRANSAFLERYLREVRPLFLGANRHMGLWAGTKGVPLNGQAIYGVTAARTRAAFGHPIGPHLFRHCAATTIAILQPKRIEVARDLLDHSSLGTTNAHYNKARSIEASRHYAGVLEQLRPPKRD